MTSSTRRDAQIRSRSRRLKGAPRVESMEERVVMATFLGLGAGNTLVQFDSFNPGGATSTSISGLNTGDSLLNFDFSPGTGNLTGLGQSGQLYNINPVSGAATLASSGPLFQGGFNGDRAGFAFNPTVVPGGEDQIQLTNASGTPFQITENNFTVNAATGALTANSNLNFNSIDPGFGSTPQIGALAFNNQFAGSGGSTLFGINAANGTLVRQGSTLGGTVSPNTGQLSTIGSLGFNTTADVGFDITPGNQGFASLTAPGSTNSSLFQVDLNTGQSRQIGQIGAAGASFGTLRSLQAIGDNVPGLGQGGNAFGITNTGGVSSLVGFNTTNPGTFNSNLTISGLNQGETINGLDFRAATGELFGLSSTGRFLSIDPTTGAATSTGAAPTTAFAGGDFDFNPTADRIRFVNASGGNFRFDPAVGGDGTADTPGFFGQGDVNFGTTPNVLSSAYTDAFAGATSTNLFNIARNGTGNLILTQQGGNGVSPNSGQLRTIGDSGINVGSDAQVAFDITPDNQGFATVTTGTGQQFFRVNLETGRFSQLSSPGAGLSAFALAPQGGVINLASSSINVDEGSTASITLNRSLGGSNGAAAVRFRIVPGSGTQFDASPLAGGGTEGIVNFAAGSNTATLDLPILADAFNEGAESFTIELFDANNGAFLGTRTSSTININDLTPVNPPDTVAPSISGVNASLSGGSLAGFDLSFSEPLTAGALAATNFTASIGGTPISLGSFTPNATGTGVTVGLPSSLPRNQLVSLQLGSGVTDASGNAISSSTIRVGVGNRFSFRDANGDRVTLRTTRGQMQVVLGGPFSDAQSVRLLGRGRLLVNVQRVNGQGDGRTTINQISAAGVAVSTPNTPVTISGRSVFRGSFVRRNA